MTASLLLAVASFSPGPGTTVAVLEDARAPLVTLVVLLPVGTHAPWAREHDFDLMLAGHVHGGQIQIPPLGPILAPSRFGVHYACGTFHEGPTVMHVSRGLSSKLPLRYFCPPEVTTLVLRK